MATTRHQRSPTGAFFRTPQGAFGAGVAAGVYTFQMFVVENQILTVEAAPCGIAVAPGGTDTFLQMIIARADGDPLLRLEYLNDMVGITVQGDQSGLTHQIGGSALNLLCDDNNNNVLWQPSFGGDAGGFARAGVTSTEVAALLDTPNPGWISGESCTQL